MDKPYLILMRVFSKEMPSWGGGEIITEIDYKLIVDVDLEDFPSVVKELEPYFKKIVERKPARDARLQEAGIL